MKQVYITLKGASGYSFDKYLTGKRLRAEVNSTGLAKVLESEMYGQGKPACPYTHSGYPWCFSAGEYDIVEEISE